MDSKMISLENDVRPELKIKMQEYLVLPNSKLLCVVEDRFLKIDYESDYDRDCRLLMDPHSGTAPKSEDVSATCRMLHQTAYLETGDDIHILKYSAQESRPHWGSVTTTILSRCDLEILRRFGAVETN